MKEGIGITSIFVAIILLMAIFAVTHQDIFYGITRTAPASAYPNSTYTPGLAATQSISDLTASYSGQTYSQAHRDVPQSEKNKVCQEYPGNCKGSYEIDHFIPVALGGSNDIKNLWAEPGTGMFNFHDKDRLETFLVAQVKAGKMSVKDAQNCIVTDWVFCSTEYLSSSPSYGGVDNETDGDDEAVE